MASPPKPITVVDPDSVPEALCDGRFYFHPHGGLGTLTFTTSRPTPGNLADGKVVTQNVVRARITMPLDNFAALREMLKQVIIPGAPPSTGGAGGTKH